MEHDGRSRYGGGGGGRGGRGGRGGGGGGDGRSGYQARRGRGRGGGGGRGGRGGRDGRSKTTDKVGHRDPYFRKEILSLFYEPIPLRTVVHPRRARETKWLQQSVRDMYEAVHGAIGDDVDDVEDAAYASLGDGHMDHKAASTGSKKSDQQGQEMEEDGHDDKHVTEVEGACSGGDQAGSAPGTTSDADVQRAKEVHRKLLIKSQRRGRKTRGKGKGKRAGHQLPASLPLGRLAFPASCRVPIRKVVTTNEPGKGGQRMLLVTKRPMGGIAGVLGAVKSELKKFAEKTARKRVQDQAAARNKEKKKTLVHVRLAAKAKAATAVAMGVSTEEKVEKTVESSVPPTSNRSGKMDLQTYMETIRARRKQYDPCALLTGTARAECTVFCARLPKDITEIMLRGVMEEYGRVEKVILIPKRSYAFVEFRASGDAHEVARRQWVHLGKHKIVVDRERGRIDPHWYPVWMGGGVSAKTGRPKCLKRFGPSTHRVMEDIYMQRERERRRDMEAKRRQTEMNRRQEEEDRRKRQVADAEERRATFAARAIENACRGTVAQGGSRGAPPPGLAGLSTLPGLAGLSGLPGIGGLSGLASLTGAPGTTSGGSTGTGTAPTGTVPGTPGVSGAGGRVTAAGGASGAAP